MPFLWLRLVQFMLTGEKIRITDAQDNSFWLAKISWVGIDYVEFLVQHPNTLIEQSTRVVLPLSHAANFMSNPSMSLRDTLNQILEKEPARGT